MAETAYGLNSDETRKVWSQGVFVEALKQSLVGRFIGEEDENDEYSVIQVNNDLKKDGGGDRIRMLLRMQVTGAGQLGDNTLEGKEEALVTHPDDIVINQLRHATKSAGQMSEQRVPYNVREQCQASLSDWWSDRFDRAFFLQTAGCNFTDGLLTEFGMQYDAADVRYTGCQAVLAPSSGYHFWSEDGTSADEDLDSTGDDMQLSFIDDLVTAAKLQSPLIRPAKIKAGSVDEEVYALVLHPRQVRDMRTNTATGQWLDIQKAAMEGGNVSGNPIFTGALGMYNNVVLHESSRIPPGVNSSTGAAIPLVRRAVFLGAQAAGLAFGKGSEFGRWNWNEQKTDFGNKLGVAAGCIFGLKKCRYNSQDFGVQVLSTYAAA